MTSISLSTAQQSPGFTPIGSPRRESVPTSMIASEVAPSSPPSLPRTNPSISQRPSIRSAPTRLGGLPDVSVAQRVNEEGIGIVQQLPEPIPPSQALLMRVVAKPDGDRLKAFLLRSFFPHPIAPPAAPNPDAAAAQIAATPTLPTPTARKLSFDS